MSAESLVFEAAAAIRDASEQTPADAVREEGNAKKTLNSKNDTFSSSTKKDESKEYIEPKQDAKEGVVEAESEERDSEEGETEDLSRPADWQPWEKEGIRKVASIKRESISAQQAATQGLEEFEIANELTVPGQRPNKSVFKPSEKTEW